MQDFGGIDIIRTLAACGTDCPPVAVVRSAPEKVAAFDQSTGGTFVIELDELLRAASPALSPSFRTPSVASAWGPGFTTSVQVLDEGDNPVARAEVQLVGQQWTAQGITGADGQVMLTLFGELPETVVQLLVKPRTGYWALWICEPRLKADTVNIVVLRHLPTVNRLGWAGQAMQFDRLPPEWRGAGVKIGLIDSGVSTSHNDLVDRI